MNSHAAPQSPHPSQSQSRQPFPRWAQKRATKLAEVWGPSRILLAYPRTRRLFALPIAAAVLVASFSLAFPTVLIAAAETRATAAVGIGLLVFFVALSSALTLLLIDSFRTSILATDQGIEVRQFPLQTRRIRWNAVHRVEAQQTGYRTGASVLVLTTGERIVCLATDPRRAVYNGYGIRSFEGPDGRIFSPTTAELIGLHGAWLHSHRAQEGL